MGTSIGIGCHHHSHRRNRSHRSHRHRRHRKSKVSAKRASFKNLKAKNAVITNLKATNAQISNLTSQTATVTSLTAQAATVTSLTAQTGNISTLTSSSITTDYLNGKKLACAETNTFFNDNSAFQLVTDNEKPAYPPRINAKVFDGLWVSTLQQKADLEARLQCGRLQERLIQEKYDCVPCPPTGYENCHPVCDEPGVICSCPTEVGDCPSVPASVFGIKTISPFRVANSTLDGCPAVVQLSSSIAFGVDVINLTGNFQVRTVTAFVQVGYLDSNGDFQYEVIDFQNRQFGPTYDTLYGEAFSSTTLLPSDLVRKLYAAMPQINNTAAIQLVMIAEEGVAIDFKASPSSNAIRSNNSATPSFGPVDSQYITDVTEAPPVPPSLVTTVGPNLDVGQVTTPQFSPIAAVDPSNPLRMFVAASNTRTAEKGIFTAYSRDGGETWTPSVTFDGTGVAEGFTIALYVSDVKYDSDGFLFVSYVGIENDAGTTVVVVSTDNGVTFSLVGQVPSVSVNDYRQSSGIALIDVSPGGDRVLYLAYVTSGLKLGVAGVRYARSTLPSSLVPVTATCPNSNGPYQITVTITPEGTLVVVFVNQLDKTTPTQIYTNRILDAFTPSPDLTWDLETSFLIGTSNVGTLWGGAGPGFGFPPQLFVGVGITPRLAYGPTGRVYLTYVDASNVNVLIGCKDMNVMMRYSDDNGLNWSNPTPVNDTSTNARFFSGLAVDQSTGIVGVSWMDCRNAPNNNLFECFASFSDNQGEPGSWIPSVQVSTNGLNNANVNISAGAGDFAYCSFSQGSFLATWSDNSGPPVLEGNPNPPGTIMNVATAVVTVSK